MKIAAFDVSLTATGWCTGGASGSYSTCAKTDKYARIVAIRDFITATALSADLVVLEGYSFASKGRAIITLGELGGVVRVALREAGTHGVEVAPSQRARYATGKGNAGKDQVLVEAVKRLGYGGHDNNEADALWLWTMAADHYGLIESPVPKLNRETLEKIAWPTKT